MTNSRQLVAGLRGSSDHEPERESACMRACVCVSFSILCARSSIHCGKSDSRDKRVYSA